MLPGFLLLGDRRDTVDGFTTLNRRAPGTWSSELRDGLLQLTRPYVLLWFDNLVPVSIGSLDALRAAVAFCARRDADYLRLNPRPPASGPEVEPGIVQVRPGELYRTSTILAIWKRARLLELLDDRESPWQFEIDGAARSDRHAGFYARREPLIDFVNLVDRGLIDPRAERRLNAHGVTLADNPRRRMTAYELTRLRLRDWRWLAFRLLPWRWRRPLRAAVRGA